MFRPPPTKETLQLSLADRESFEAAEQRWNQRYESEAWTTEPESKIVEALSQLPPGFAIDLGCGTGRHSIWLALHGWRVLGVDASEIGLSQLQSQARNVGVEIKTLHGDLRYNPSPNHDADVVLIANIHFDDDGMTQLFQHVCRLLKAGGTLVLSGHSYRTPQSGRSVRRDLHLTVPRVRALLPDCLTISSLEESERHPEVNSPSGSTTDRKILLVAKRISDDPR